MKWEDVRIMTDAFVVIMATEVIMKPVATRAGRWVLQVMDNWLRWIPDWLYKKAVYGDGEVSND